MTGQGRLNDRDPVVPSPPDHANIWWYEDQTTHRRLSLRVRRVLHEVRSPYQHLTVLDVHDNGPTLVLDGCVQLTGSDEFMYHEMLVHPVLFCLPPAFFEEGLRALIIGGGDGGTAREILRHPGVAQVDLIDIDEEVTRASKEYFPSIWNLPDGSRLDDDARLRILHEDGIDWARRHAAEGRTYHAVFVDSTDPIGPGTILFSDEFYDILARLLPDEGAVSVQAGSPIHQPEVTRMAAGGLGRAFGNSRVHVGIAPSYPGGLWCYATGSRAGAIGPAFPDDDRARRIHESIRGTDRPLRFYDLDIHRACFSLPVFVRELLEEA